MLWCFAIDSVVLKADAVSKRERQANITPRLCGNDIAITLVVLGIEKKLGAIARIVPQPVDPLAATVGVMRVFVVLT